MELISDHRKIVAKYFQAWKTYDTLSVVQLFDAKARYEIRSKQRTLNGHAEICEYWRRNEQRQKGLKLLWNLLSTKKTYAKAHFVAEFYDKEEDEYQKVIGIIEFYLNDQQAVTLLSEHYKKSIVGEENGFMPGIE